jgi:hypothetical protein
MPKLVFKNNKREIVYENNDGDDWEELFEDKVDLKFVPKGGNYVVIINDLTWKLYFAHYFDDEVKDKEIEIEFETSKPGEDMKVFRCPICDTEFWYHKEPYRPGLICLYCAEKALDSHGNKPWHDSLRDVGSNPVFVGEHECYVRYRFGASWTMLRSEWLKEFPSFDYK